MSQPPATTIASAWEERADACLADVASAVSLGPLDDVVGVLLDRVRAGLDFDTVALFDYQDEATELRLLAHRGPSTSIVPVTIAVDDGLLVSRAVATRQAQFVEDARAPPGAPARDPLLNQMSGGGAALALPLVFGGRLLGVLVALVGTPRSLSSTARAKIVTLARVIAMVLAESVSRRGRRELSDELLRLQRSSQAVVDLLSVLPEQQLLAAVHRGFRAWPTRLEPRVPGFVLGVLQRVVDEARVVAGAAIGAFGIGSDSNCPFNPWVTSGVSPEEQASLLAAPRPVGMLGAVAIEGKTLRTPHPRDCATFRGLPPNHPPVASFLGIPIQYSNQPVGSLYLANKQGAAEFSEDDARAVEVLACQVGIALQQAWLLTTIDTQSAAAQSLLDSAPHGVLFIDAETKRVTANPAALRLHGTVFAPDATSDAYLAQLHSWDGGPISLEELPSHRAMRGEESATTEYLLSRPDGSQIPVSVSAAPVRAIGNKIVGAVVNVVDVSAVRELDRMHALRRMREQFNAMVANDLRNPIQTVLAQLYLLIGRAEAETDAVTVPVAELQRIERSATALGRMSDKLLEAAQVELQCVELTKKPTSLPHAIEDLLRRMRPNLQHRIQLSVEGPLPPINLDGFAFEQILTDVIENAAAYSSPITPIQIAVRPERGGVAISITDQGCGIAPEDQERLFDGLYQATRARKRKRGLGLGLFIVKGYVEAHGGKICVESQVGKGTTFHLWFPEDGTVEKRSR